jgi:hypothetical protein
MVLLVDAFQNWVGVVLAAPPIVSRNHWDTGMEGSVYVRYCTPLKRLDLANFSILKPYRKQGVAKELIHTACSLDVDCVRIENILNHSWYMRLREYTYPGRRTMDVNDVPGWPPSVLFMRKSRESTK